LWPLPPERRRAGRRLRTWPNDQAGAPIAARFTAAKFVFSCVPSQNGFVFEWPHRQRAIVSLA
jgi:hypothetical protein